jgi:hypothetical protein
MFYQPSRARVRTLVHALCIAPAIFSAPLHAQETPDVQTQLKQIQASLNQIRSEYEQRIATLEAQVNQLQKENGQLSARVTSPAKAPPPPLAQTRQEPPAKSTTPAQQRVAKAESVEEAITAVAPPPAAAAPTPFPNLGGKDRTIDLGAELFLDAKYSSQSQNPENAYEVYPVGSPSGKRSSSSRGRWTICFAARPALSWSSQATARRSRRKSSLRKRWGCPGALRSRPVNTGRMWAT